MARCKKSFIVEATAIPRVHDFVKATLSAHGINTDTAGDIILACDEAATNIVEHAFEGKIDKMAPQYFVLTLHCQKSKITATFFDEGNTFNIKEIEPPDITKNLRGEKKGGYGVFLIRKLVDKIVYTARRHLNVTRLVKQT